MPRLNLFFFLTSDAFLFCFFLLFLSILSLKLIPLDRFSLRRVSLLWQEIVYGPQVNKARKDRNRALAAFYYYGDLALPNVKQMWTSYARVDRVQKRIGYILGYTRKLDRLEEVTKINAKLAKAISENANDDASPLFFSSDTGDLGKVREAMRHFVRDWSVEGSQERSVIFSPILDILAETAPEDRKALKVLIPGSGLGRLAWEICELGYEATANELSPYMNIAFHYLISTIHTSQHVIYPYAHWFSHQRSNEALFRAVFFPDALPRLSESFLLLEQDFLTLKPPFRGDEPSGYDYIVTLFFIDTSLNIISTLEQVHRLLRPGGTWINLGPLLWTGGSQASLELSLEELLHLVGVLGFEIDQRSKKTVECEYTADLQAMMRWIYKAEFWTAKKKE